MFFVLDSDIEFYNYADDNTLLCYGKDYETVKQKLSKNVDNMVSWFKRNDMKINPDKFQYIVFGDDECISGLTVDNCMLHPQDSVNILGFFLDKDMKFDEQVNKICQKA